VPGGSFFERESHPWKPTLFRPRMAGEGQCCPGSQGAYRQPRACSPGLGDAPASSLRPLTTWVNATSHGCPLVEVERERRADPAAASC